MKRKVPLSFYFKLTFILLILGVTYLYNRPLIDATFADENLSTIESVNVILQSVLGMQGNIDLDQPTGTSSEMISFPGNTQPQRISDEVKAHPNYQLAIERAQRFNQNFNAEEVNDFLTNKINEFRMEYGSTNSSVASYLADGSRARALELGTYHYLSSSTVDGFSFYSLFPEIIEPQYRLGENLYELYIAAEDIHLETWENSEILADYIYGVFQESLETELYQNYHGIYAWVHAEPSDYQMENASYVRLVVVLLLDTQIE